MLTAYRYVGAPEAYRLPPSLHAALRDLLIEGGSVEDLEARRGWAARSAKDILRVLLNALDEPDGFHVVADPEGDALRQELAYVCAEDARDVFEVLRQFDFTAFQARLFLVLQRSRNGEASRDAIVRRLSRQVAGEDPSEDSIDVHVCNMRPKLKGTSFRIETIRGIGYRLVENTAVDCDPQTLEWYVRHVLVGQSIRAIAEHAGLSPSTVYRRLHQLIDSLQTDQQQNEFDAVAKEWLQKHGEEALKEASNGQSGGVPKKASTEKIA